MVFSRNRADSARSASKSRSLKLAGTTRRIGSRYPSSGLKPRPPPDASPVPGVSASPIPQKTALSAVYQNGGRREDGVTDPPGLHDRPDLQTEPPRVRMARDEAPGPARAGRRPPVPLAQLPAARPDSCCHRRCNHDSATVLNAGQRTGLGVPQHRRGAGRACAARLGRGFGTIRHVGAKHGQPARVRTPYDRGLFRCSPSPLRRQRPDGVRPVALPGHLVPARHPRAGYVALLRADRHPRRGVSRGPLRRGVRGVVVARARRLAIVRVVCALGHPVLVEESAAPRVPRPARRRRGRVRVRRHAGEPARARLARGRALALVLRGERGALPDLRRAQARHAAA